jgi:heptosyltransferase-2
MLLTRAVDRPGGAVHQVDSYQHLVRALGFANGSPVPQLAVPRALSDAAVQELRAAGWDGQSPLVALAPGAAFGPSKLWPARSFAELAAGLAADGVTCVLVGAAPDQQIAEQVMRESAAAPLNLVGRTNVPILAGVLAQCRAAVGNDSGAIHLAAAVGIRTTALFGPTNERLTAPRGTQESVVLTNPVWCRPCMLRDCPLDHACLRGIPVAAALRTAQAR